jgi:rhodanese-related sulfurtransferase
MNYRIVLIFMLISFKIHAQVQSAAFKTLLETMLKKDVPTISCEELKKMDNVILLDTRAKKEFDVSHLKNAIWVGYEEFKLENVKNIPKDARIVVYCSIGVRSEKIGEKLQNSGFRNVNNLYGSIFEWINQGNTVYDSAEKPTDKVHGYSRLWGIWAKKGKKVYDN